MRIYITDANSETLDFIEKELRNDGNGNYDFRKARNGKELLDIIHEEGNPDLLILDLLLPVMSGFDVMRAFCSDKAKYDFPIVVVTALTEQSRIRQAYELGASDVIVKPFFLEDFTIRVGKIINDFVAKKELEKSVRMLNNNIHNLQYESLLHLCAVVEAKDGLTGEHIERVGRFSFRVAQVIGLKDGMCERIRLASKLHDLGKVAIPDSILHKPGKLTAEEFAVIKTHATKGAEIIKASTDNVILSVAKDIILYHHEHFNGNGYPFGCSGKNIPLSARITAVADVFDALTHDRVYKKAWSEDQAIDYISQQRGKQFDPEIVDAVLLLQNF
jgi:putative two-component system response regulator